MGFKAGVGTQGSSISFSVTYLFTKDWEGALTKKTTIIPESKTPREISIWTDKPCLVFYGNQGIELLEISNQLFIDSTIGSNLSLQPLEGKTNVKVLIRSVKPIAYNIGEEELMIPVDVRLAIGTGDNFVDVNEGSYQDFNESQYIVNLQKLKNSDSGITGWKLFDLLSFFPGKLIEFNVVVDSTGNDNYTPNTIAAQLFDPLTLGEVFFGIANDVVNLELNSLGDKFVGNLTRNAWYKPIENNKLLIKPNYSWKTGRFVAKNLNTNAYDTVIIKEYLPNIDPFLGGTFVLTGSF